jgi:predicted ATPase/class 3 adenylate cyclase
MDAAAVLEAHSFLFTDIVGSTLHWERADRAMHSALARHDEIARTAIASNGGRIMHAAGDGFCSAFPNPVQAVKAAISIHRALAEESWNEIGPLQIRAAIHSGEAYERDGDYFGPSVNRTSRILSLANGQQTLLSQAAYQQVRFAAPANELILRDLGVHRLKDLQEPEHLWQATHVSLPYDFPPLRSLDHFPNNLPQFLSSFVGRERDLKEVVARLKQTRLLTLTGFGGAGKTRLALQAAANLQDDFADGVWLVRLESVPDPSLVDQEIANVLKIREQPGTPILSTVTQHLRSRQALLVLDNCEHVLEECSTVAARLLAVCPDVRVMTTSRQALGIAGESTYHVRPLGTPPVDSGSRSKAMDPSMLLRCESVRLFAERAIMVQPRFTITAANCLAIAQICRSLDGIPLAIELAAARVRAMSVNQIADRVEDRFRLLTSGRRDVLPRHQTLRALIEWSSDLLTDEERLLFSRLAVFNSGWTLEACEEVCAGGRVEAWMVIDLLTALVDKSLVVTDYVDGQYRYSLLETVHDYCWERLRLSEEELAIRERHRDYFVALAEKLAPSLAEGSAAALSQIEVEHDNLRAAIDYCLNAVGGHVIGLRLACALERFWEVRGYCREGRGHFDALLARAGGEPPDALSAQALTGAGILAFRSGDFDSARGLHEASLAIWQQLSIEPKVAEALENLGNVAEDQGQFEKARDLYAQALEINRKVGNLASEALNLGNLGSVSAMMGHFDTADDYISASIDLSRKIGNHRCIGFALYCAGLSAYRRGDFATSRTRHGESLAVWRAIGSRLGIAFCLEAFFELAAAADDFDKAVRLYSAAMMLRQEIGEPPPPVRVGEYAAVLARLKEQFDEAAYAFAFAQGQSMSTEEAVTEALA